MSSLGRCNPQQLLEQHTSLAVHAGTCEAAIENMLRRLHDQDRQDEADNIQGTILTVDGGARAVSDRLTAFHSKGTRSLPSVCT